MQSSQRYDNYEYDPLPTSPRTIRLLELEPGQWNAPLRYNLHTEDLDSKELDYEAVSYTWGDKSNTVDTLCHNRILRVTKSIFSALQVFRYVDRPRILWADAICIDQQDDDERSDQVQLMRHIYKKASKVLIWMGHDDEETIRNGMDLACRIAAHYTDYSSGDCNEKIPRENPERPVYYWKNEEISPSVQPVSLDGLSLPPLNSLFECAWWSRLWVIQEACLSSSADIYWGRARVDFSWLQKMVGHVLNYHSEDEASFSRGYFKCNGIRRIMDKSSREPFFWLLNESNRSSASNPRDKVFALLGLQTSDADPENESLFIQPDYNLTILEVYTKVAEKYVSELKNLGILSYVHHTRSVSDDWTSWVPNWDQRLPTALFSKESALVQIHKTSYGEGPHITRPECTRHNCISIRGIRVDDVHSFLDADFDVLTSEGGMRRPKFLQRLAKELLEKKELNIDTLALTLTTGFRWILLTDGRDKAYDDLMTAFRDFLTLDFDSLKGTLYWEDAIGQLCKQAVLRSTSEEIRDVVDAICRHSYTRHVFETREGMLGLGPGIMQKGDIVAVLFGGSLPFILRPVGSEYRLVGNCYVLPIVQGESVRKWKESGEPAIDFHIY